MKWAGHTFDPRSVLAKIKLYFLTRLAPHCWRSAPLLVLANSCGPFECPQVVGTLRSGLVTPPTPDQCWPKQDNESSHG